MSQHRQLASGRSITIAKQTSEFAFQSEAQEIQRRNQSVNGDAVRSTSNALMTPKRSVRAPSVTL